MLVQQIRDIVVEIPNQQGTGRLADRAETPTWPCQSLIMATSMETRQDGHGRGGPEKLLKDADVQEFYLGLQR